MGSSVRIVVGGLLAIPVAIGLFYIMQSLVDRDFKQEDVAKTSDANKKALLVEYALIAKNEAASGICADLTVS